MGETFTKNLNVTINKAIVEELDTIALLGRDEVIFYQIIRSDLDKLQRMPRKQTIDRILNFSMSLRK